MLCAVLKQETEPHHYMGLADLVELRLDLFSSPLQAIPEDLPVILTLRCRSQGGNYQGTEEERLIEIDRLASLKPAYIDLESHLPLDSIKRVQDRHPEVKWILSYHDFERTPEDLEGLYEELKKKPASLYKIAARANSSLDTLRMLKFIKGADQRVIGISMGALGTPSRILAPLVGAPWTYAALSDEEAIEGQLSASTLKDLYHYPHLNPSTKIYGLIGDPIDQSIGHLTHNPLLQGLNGVYLKFEVKKQEVAPFLELAKQLPFAGFSVTMPLKEECQHFAAENKIGAVNTLLFNEGQIEGFNTDGFGACEAIEEEISLQGKHLIILGAGGAAKAIIHEALKRGAHLTILNRDLRKAKELALKFSCQADILDRVPSFYDLMINCTPVLPINPDLIRPGTYVMDLQTYPKLTPFLEEALARNCKVIPGYKMFIHQALGQFGIWFEGDFDRSKTKLFLEEKVEELLKG